MAAVVSSMIGNIRERHLVGWGDSDVEATGDKGTLCCSRKLDMKAFREDESLGKPEIDGPAAIEELSPTLALKPHRRLIRDDYAQGQVSLLVPAFWDYEVANRRQPLRDGARSSC
jgi:hypothetical protein